MSWLKEDNEGITINVRVVPRASRNEIAGLHGDAVKIRLQAPPVDGKANAALIKFLASRLDVARRQVTILSGESGRQKRVRINGISRRNAISLCGE